MAAGQKASKTTDEMQKMQAQDEIKRISLCEQLRMVS